MQIGVSSQSKSVVTFLDHPVYAWLMSLLWRWR